MQNTIQNFTKQNFTVFKKSRNLSEHLKTLTSSNYPSVQYLLLKLRIRFLLTNVYKRMCDFLKFYLHFELFAKVKKRPGFCTLVFYTFFNNSRSKQNKSHTSFCRHY